jgi:hypothetical protein
LILATVQQAQAQLHMEDHDRKPYYFGITLAANQSNFKLSHAPYFLDKDSIYIAEPKKTIGFNLGLLANLKLNHRFDVRANPQLVFANKDLYYKDIHPTFQDTDKKIESILLSFPFHIKFKSDRIGNLRVYTIGGIKFDYDLSSNARMRRAENLVKIGKIDYGFELGAGFEFYMPSFIFTPEIKISNGVRNVHEPDPNLRYSNVVDQLRSRTIVFSIHLQG